MSEIGKAMVEEITAYVREFRSRNDGARPTQQELDDYMDTWKRTSKRGMSKTT